MGMLMKVDAAVIVPVNIFPLTDDTDFKTRETGVAYNAAGMALTWNFVTPAGVQTQTAVTPTTGGVYDWVHLGGGMYSMKIPASGGASINNSTKGYGWFTGYATGILPWTGPVISFAPAITVDALMNGTDLLDVSVTQILGTAISTPATAGILDVNVKNMNNVAATSITAVNANQGTTQPVNFTGTGASALVKTDMVDVAGAAVSTTTAQLGVNTVSLSANAITATAINASAITAAKIATDAITSAKIAAGAIASTTFAAGAITNAAIADGAVSAAKLATDAITAEKISSDAIVKVQDGLQKTLFAYPTSSNLVNGTESGGTYITTQKHDGVYNIITAADGSSNARIIDVTYNVLMSSTAIPMFVKIYGYLLETAPAGGDTIALYMFNYNSEEFDLIQSSVFTGVSAAAASYVNVNIGTDYYGLNGNNIVARFRFYNAGSLEDGTTLNIDSIIVEYTDSLTGSLLNASAVQHAVWDVPTTEIQGQYSVGAYIMEGILTDIEAHVWDVPADTHVTMGTFGDLVNNITDNVWNAPVVDHQITATTGKALTDGIATPPDSIANAVWDELLSEHTTTGTAGKALTSAGTAGDPWSTALPGSYGSGTAGKIIGDNVNATISSRATSTEVAGIDAKIGAPLDLGNGIATIAGNLTDMDAEVDEIHTDVSNLAVTGAALTTLANGFTLVSGTQTSGTYVSTASNDGVRHVITAASGSTNARLIDCEYLFTLPTSAGVPGQIEIIGFLKETAPAGGDTIALHLYNYDIAQFEIVSGNILTGITGTTNETVVHKMFLQHVGKSGGDVGKIRVRFYSTTLEDNTTLNIDSLVLSYAEAISGSILTILAETAKIPKSDSNVTWNVTALGSINAEVDTALNTAIPASNTTNSVNDILLDVVPTIKTDTTAILIDTGTTLDARIPSALVNGRIDSYTGAMAANVITATAIQADAITDSKVASDVTIASVTGTVGSIATGGIVAASFATDAITSNAVAATAVSKIQSGLATPTNIAGGTITTVTNLTNAPTVGDLTAAMKASINAEVDAALNTAIPDSPTANSINERIVNIDGYGVPPNVVDIANQIWNDSIVSHQTAGSTGKALSDAGTVTAATVADAVWDELLSLHASSGSAGNALATASSGGVDPAVLADAVCDELLSGHTIAGSVGKKLGDLQIVSAADVNAQCDTALSDVGLTTTVTGRIDASISSRGVALTASGVRGAIGMEAADLDLQLGALPTLTQMNDRTLPSADYAVAGDKMDLVANPAITSLSLSGDLNIGGDINISTDVNIGRDMSIVRDFNVGGEFPVSGGGGNAPTVEEIDTRLSATHGSGAWGGGTPGAFQVEFTITDADAAPIPGVAVILLNSTQTVVLSTGVTNVLGKFTTSADIGTYKVRLTKAMVNFTVPETLTVTADTYITYTGDVISPAAPASGLQNVYIIPVNGDLQYNAYVEITAQIISVNNVIDTSVITKQVLFAVNDGAYWYLSLAIGGVFRIQGMLNNDTFMDKTITVTDVPTRNIKDYL